MENSTGIVIVSYNAPQAVIMTLDSLAAAHVDARFSVALLDNGSSSDAEALITESMNRHLAAGHFQGRLFLLQSNKGFSGGNNVGITYFLSQPDITHICLLNSDVVVSDHWLDYLLEGGHDAVGPLTNASNNEQGIPVPYTVSRNNGELTFDENAYRDFAAYRRDAWKGCVCTSGFISFFCTLFSRKLLQKVGYLDTRFHPGAYEDDDYCVRILENGFTMHVRRDVFLHHWGSASFSKLAIPERHHHGMRNRARFAAKYHRPWQDRSHLPWRAWAQDALFALEHPERKEAYLPTLRLYESEIATLAQALDARCTTLADAAGRPSPFAPEDSLRLRTERFAADIAHCLSAGSVKADLQRLTRDCAALETAVTRLTAACADMAVSPANTAWTCPPAITHGEDGVEELWNLLRQIERGVVFFAGYPFPERLKDGYFQRVAAIDRLLPQSHYRIYCDVSDSFSDDETVEIISDNTVLLRVRPADAAHQLLVSNAVLRCKVIYYHSILRTMYPIQRMWLHEKGIRKIFDVHGVVPEEFIYCSNDYVSSSFYSEFEALALNQCDTVVTVSEAMRKHLEEKYSSDYGDKAITMPILPAIATVEPSRPESGKCVKIVYAGGSHPWQCVPRMLDAIAAIIDTVQVDIFATKPEEFLALTPQTLLHHPNFRLTTAAYEDLCAQYPSYQYGFLLRDDVAVNRAACPTKLVEYLASCIVPILDFEGIGDFAELGMKYLPADKLKAGELLSPEEHHAYTRHNLTVLKALQEKAAVSTRLLQNRLIC